MELSPLEYDLMELRTVARRAEDGRETRRGGSPERDDGPTRGDEPRRADGGAAVAGGTDRWAETGAQQPDTTQRPEQRTPPADGERSSTRPGQYRGEVPDHLRSTGGGATGAEASPRHDPSSDGVTTHGRDGQREQRTLPYAALTDAAAQERPYLRSLPGSATTDLLVLQWLEGLVERGGIEGARNALEYYRDIDWVTEEAAANLQAYLGGLPEPTADPPGLTTDDHRTSLEFIVHIAGPGGD